MRLWNAHRRVFHKRKLPLLKRLALKNEPNGWRQLLTEDVIKFIVDLEWYNLAGSQKEQEQRISTITRDPANYFSRPKNVPLELRTQIYLPEFVVTFIRTPHLAPKYASFWVPLWFNKLDFKNYLKNVYNVDVLHIRSYVQQQKVQREERMVGGTMNQGQGRLYRPPARKKMTVELVDPFVYPEEEKDLSAWEADTFKRESKENSELSQEAAPGLPQIEANTKERESIAQQAKEYVEGKQRWKPSWQLIPADGRIMRNTSRPPGLRV